MTCSVLSPIWRNSYLGIQSRADAFRPYMSRFWAGWGLIRKRKVQCRALWSSFESQNSFSDLKILGFMRVYFVDFFSTLNTRIIRYQHNLVEPWPERAASNLPLSIETSPSPKSGHIRTKNVSPQTHVSDTLCGYYSALHYSCLPLKSHVKETFRFQVIRKVVGNTQWSGSKNFSGEKLMVLEGRLFTSSATMARDSKG